MNTTEDWLYNGILLIYTCMTYRHIYICLHLLVRINTYMHTTLISKHHTLICYTLRHIDGFDSNKSEYTRKLDELKVCTHILHRYCSFHSAHFFTTHTNTILPHILCIILIMHTYIPISYCTYIYI